jgi:hypothetical protein
MMSLRPPTLPSRKLGPTGLWLIWVALLAAGCGSPLRFPAAPLSVKDTPEGRVSAYDTNGDRRPDYFTTQDKSGRIVRIAYDQTMRKGEPDSTVNLDEIQPSLCRHIVFILDGIGYDVVEEFRKEGRLRLFYPPVRVISTFPAMTDIALGDVFQSVPCIAPEAVHFDHQANRIVGGDADYLSLRNEDWARHVDYRAGTLVDPLAYLYPSAIFNKELADVLQLFDRRDRSVIVAYLVSTAGLGTREGREGQRKALDRLDRLCQELVWRTRGCVKFTMFSDHGHTLVRSERIDFRGFLAGKGWRVTDHLEKPRDVVPVEYGIVTYASFATLDRAALAADLLTHPGVDLVTYQEGDAVVVEKPDAKAYVERKDDGGFEPQYRYRTEKGDPLELLPLIQSGKVKRGPDGYAIDMDRYSQGDAWFQQTATHRYPDALDRLWRAFRGQTEHVPDVIASLKGGYCAGSASRAFFLPYVASTHGDLERKSSTAFIISTTEPRDQSLGRMSTMRSRDLPPLLQSLTDRPWPPPVGGSGKP